MSNETHEELGETLLVVDSRRRISLGRHARHEHYVVTEEPGGVIILTPVVVVPINHPGIKEYLEAKKNLETKERSDAIMKRHAERVAQMGK